MNYLNNKSFSTTVDKLQLAWDQTCIGLLKECPRKYEYTVIYGYGIGDDNPHLVFGSVYHAALERYDHARAEGLDHDPACLAAVDYALRATWNFKLNRAWLSNEPTKTRFTLIRAVVWYLEQFRTDPLQTVILANGKPAVELSFQFESGLFTSTGEQFVLAGHIDRVADLGSSSFIIDKKTTKHELDDDYFSQYSPDNQFSLYPIAGRVAFQVPVKGIIVDAVQIGVTFSRYERREIYRDDAQLDDWMRDLKLWLTMAEIYARTGRWPMNDRACFRCHFRPICGRSPAVREMWLKGKFQPRVWDPLTPRGNV